MDFNRYLNRFKQKNISKVVIPGVILIYSCHKYLKTRLEKYVLHKNTYNGWKVFIIIGDPFLKTEYEFIDDTNIIKIRCEDSYIHLCKKVILGIKIVLDIYTLTEGILRCGDDLIFNEDNLEKFLRIKNKNDYIGNPMRSSSHVSKVKDNFMPDYFAHHREDLENPLNGIKYNLEELLLFNERPSLSYAAGVIVYYSIKSCNILIEHMKQIDWNIFEYSVKYGYPYIIEDVGVGFILNKNGIYPTYYNMYINTAHVNAIGIHTNDYK